MAEQRWHVMTLGKQHQEALWLILYNFHGLFLLHQMQKVASFDDDRAVLDRHALSMNHLDHCLQIMELVRQSNGKYNKMVIFNQKSMGIITSAVQAYDPEQTCLNQDDIRMLRREIAGLQKLVEESNQFMYTQDELRKAGLKT